MRGPLQRPYGRVMTNAAPSQPQPSRARLGLPLIALIGLALVAVPRVVLHDLGLITEATSLNAIFVFAPAVIWIVVVLWQRVPNPFLTLLVVGALYGVFLALGHQLLWGVGFGADGPRLGGNLADLDPRLQAAIIRGFAAVSSLFTGVIVGAITGVVAWGISRVTSRGRKACWPSAGPPTLCERGLERGDAKVLGQRGVLPVELSDCAAPSARRADDDRDGRPAALPVPEVAPDAARGLMLMLLLIAMAYAGYTSEPESESTPRTSPGSTVRRPSPPRCS